MLPGGSWASCGEFRPAAGSGVPLFLGSYPAVCARRRGVRLYRLHGFRGLRGSDRGRGLRATPSWHFRQLCRCTGSGFGRVCVGSSIGLMVILVALSVMSIIWMSVITVLALGQKLLPAKAAVDVPLALAIVGLGILIVVAPASVPGLMPSM